MRFTLATTNTVARHALRRGITTGTPIRSVASAASESSGPSYTQPDADKMVDATAPTAEEKAALMARSFELPVHTLSPRQICDAELLLNGGFDPLDGFLTRTHT